MSDPVTYIMACECPATGGGGGGGGPTYSVIKAVDGLTGLESVGSFIITVRRDHNILTDPLTAVTVSWSLAPRQSCVGVGRVCPHMIPSTTGTLHWAIGEVADKFITVPLITHGPPMFYTCIGQPPGGELGWLHLTVTFGSAATESGIGAVHRYDVAAACNHAALNGGGTPFFGVPRRTQYTGIGRAPLLMNFANLNPAWTASYQMRTIEQFDAAGATVYKDELTVNGAGTIIVQRTFGSRALYSSGGGQTEVTRTETLWEHTRPHFTGTLRQTITLSEPFQPTSQIAAVQNLARARLEFDDVGGAYATPGPSTFEGYEYPTEAGWDYVQRAVNPSPTPCAVPNPWTEGNAGFYRWPSYIGMFGMENETVWLAAIKVDGRGLAVGSPSPVFMEIRVISYRFTNIAMTTWVEESDTGWFDITDNVYWAEPPAVPGFRRITHRTNPTPPYVPPGFYCHPGYVP